MLKIGTIGFGGGSALIPVFDDELVHRRRALGAETFVRHTVVGSITPGALPVKLAGLAGLELAGARLAVLMALAVALPGTALTVALVSMLAAAGEEAVRYIEFASVGITVFIVALLVHYVTTVWAHSTHPTPAVVATFVIAAATGTPGLVRLLGSALGRQWQVTVPTLTAVQVIGATLAVVTLRALLRRRRNPTPPAPTPRPASSWPTARRASLAFVAVAVVAVGIAALAGGARAAGLMALVAASTLSSFGGGEAYVAVADSFFVAGGFVDSTTFYTQIVPIANALPGPILVKIASAIGLVSTESGAGAWSVAAAAAIVAVAASSAVAVAVMAAYDRLRTSPVFADIGTFVLPVIAGLLISTSSAMVNTSVAVAEQAAVAPALVVWVSTAAVALVAGLRHRRLVPDLALLLGCGALSLTVLAL